MKKQMLSAFLAASMVLTMVPAASAVDETEETSTVTTSTEPQETTTPAGTEQPQAPDEETVEKNEDAQGGTNNVEADSEDATDVEDTTEDTGNEGIDTLAELKSAITNADDDASSEITLSGDITIPAGPENNIVINSEITINGNGHKLIKTFDTTQGDSGYGNYEAVFQINAGNVTIKNLTMSGLENGMKDEAAIYIATNESVTITECKFIGTQNEDNSYGTAGIIGATGYSPVVHVSDCEFQYVKYGMYFNSIGSQSVISDNMLDTTSYTGIYMDVPASSTGITVSNNNLTNIAMTSYNSVPFISGIYVNELSESTPALPVTMKNNTVELSETAQNNGGIAIKNSKVAKIGETYYATLEGAITAAKANDTIVLKQDIQIAAGNANNIVINKAITIDGDNHTIIRSFDKVPDTADPSYGNYESVFVIQSAGVTIQNLKMAGLEQGMKDESAICIEANGTNESPIQILNCTFVGSADAVNSGIVGILTLPRQPQTGGYVNVQNCKMENLKYGMYFNSISNATIQGNTIDGTAYTGIYLEGTDVTLKGNTLKNIATANNETADFSSGIFMGGTSSRMKVSENNIALASGNTNGYELGMTQDGSAAEVTVMVGDAPYTSLEAAVAAVQAGQTITLLQDAELTQSIVIDEANVTLDGAGHTIAYTGNATAEKPAGALIVAQATGDPAGGTPQSGADSFTLKNVTVDAENCKYGVQLYCIEKSKLDSVTVTNGVYSSILVNGAEAEVANTTVDNGIEYGVGTGVTTLPEITLNNVTGKPNGPLIKVDKSTIENIKNNVSGMNNFTPEQIVGEINKKLEGAQVVLGEDGSATSPVTSFTITFDPAGGTFSDGDTNSRTLTTNNEGKLKALPTVTREGYTFEGWYASGIGQIDVNTTFTQDTTVSASWDSSKSSSGGGSSGGGGGSSSSSSRYSVSVSSTSNGSVSVSPKSASKGKTVTITVKPDAGYELDELTVTDKDGDEIRVERESDTKYTFTMPSGKVTVKATFAKVSEQPEHGSMAFTDVASSAYYYDAVKWAVEQGITSGITATTFGPDASCTRAQMVSFLWRANGSPKAAGANPFTDVSADAYYYDAVLWAVEKGITSGTSATTFSPNATVTRGQTVSFLHRANGSPAVSGSSPFTDVAADAYYAAAVQWAVAENITAGTSATTFSPDAACTRGQIVSVLYRDMA